MKSLINHEANELNYFFAGYFEGRGVIDIQYSKKLHKCKSKSYYGRVRCSFDNIQLAKLFQQDFGGNILLFPLKFVKARNVKRKYVWTITSGVCMDFLYAIKPYIFSKILLKKVNLAIKFWKFHEKNLNKQGKTKISDKIGKKRKEFYQKMKRLNK